MKMAKGRKASITKHKSDRDVSTSDEAPAPAPVESTHRSKRDKRKRKDSENSEDDDLTVHLRNADMFAKYREMNPHIEFQKSQTTSNFTPDELSDSDEVWIFEVPNDIDPTALVGQTVKLGSRRSALKLNDVDNYECVSEKYDVPKTVSLVCQKKNSQLIVKNTRPVGRVVLRQKLAASFEVPIDSDESKVNAKVPMPKNLKVRHPILGVNYEDSIELSETIREKLAKAEAASLHRPARKNRGNKAPAGDIETIKIEEPAATPRKSKKRKLATVDSDEDALPASSKKVKRENEVKVEDSAETDLDWIKQL